MPRALLRRLYSIQDISVTRQPLPTPPTIQKAGRGPSVSRVGREREDEGGALDLDEAKSFLEAFDMAADGDSFPMRVAWELQNEFWQQNEIEVMSTFQVKCTSEPQHSPKCPRQTSHEEYRNRRRVRGLLVVPGIALTRRFFFALLRSPSLALAFDPPEHAAQVPPYQISDALPCPVAITGKRGRVLDSLKPSYPCRFAGGRQDIARD